MCTKFDPKSRKKCGRLHTQNRLANHTYPTPLRIRCGVEVNMFQVKKWIKSILLCYEGQLVISCIVSNHLNIEKDGETFPTTTPYEKNCFLYKWYTYAGHSSTLPNLIYFPNVGSYIMWSSRKRRDVSRMHKTWPKKLSFNFVSYFIQATISKTYPA